MVNFTQITSQDIKYAFTNVPHIIFEVTDACNLRCKYCGYADLYEGYDKREDRKLPFHKAKLIIDYLHAIWKEHHNTGNISPITIGFYGGEPLLNVPFIKQVMDYLESLEPVGKKFIYNMTTNAMLLDKYMSFLAEKKVRLLISLDGDKEGQGYRVDAAGKNSFDRVFRNINLLKEKYPDYFKRYVMFNSVLHNKNSVESIFHFIKNTFDKEPSISPLNDSGIRKDKIEEFYHTYQNYNESINKASNCETLKKELFIMAPEISTLLEYIHIHTNNVYNNYNSFFIESEKVGFPPTGTCIPFTKKMFITVNGKILQCERINHEFAVGQVTDTTVELDFEKIAQQHNRYVFKYAKQCKSCARRKACTQCVYQIDSIHEKDTTCYGYCTPEELSKGHEIALKYLGKHPELYKRILTNVVVRG